VRLTPRIEAGEVEARAEIVRRILAGNVELFFRSVELASSETDEWPRVRMSAQPYTLTSRERRSETAARRYAERREILALRA
jgi:hypothetical protein